jgi:glycosyltransferase involved in cell wall biosynthesis
MGTGLPVVATDVGGTRELVVHRQTGLLVPSGEPVALASALRSLLQAPSERAAMGAAARRRAETVFSLETMIDEYTRVYRDLAARRPQRGAMARRSSPAHSLH